MSFYYLYLLLVLNVLNSIVLMGYNNSKSVSTYAFGIPTNNLYSVHGSIYQRDAVSARYEEKRSSVARCMGGEAKAPRRVVGLNQCLELVPSNCQNEALQLLFMMVLTHTGNASRILIKRC